MHQKDFPFHHPLHQIRYSKNTLLALKHLPPKHKSQQHLHFLYPPYQQLKNQKHLFHFHHILYPSYQILKQNPHFLTPYQKTFPYFLIHQFQH
ncbi:UvrD-helicase domain-containing protein, partial [Priestia megaterium]|uniref:UvrD-helicase domain-containing protein n=1 Tax=Priestia megaterium TaxID=1404 RepID=UPI003709AF55